MTPAFSKKEQTTTKFMLILPSGNGLEITLYPETERQDIEFVERVLEIACEERKKLKGEK